MAWQCECSLEKYTYRSRDERSAYRAGYSDSFHGYPMWSGNERDFYPEAYRNGYAEANFDKQPQQS